MSLTPLSKFADPSQWDHVDYDVPIFIAHDLYELNKVKNAKGEKVKVAVVPGDDVPEDATFLYSIGPKDLEKIQKKISAAYQRTGNAIKVFIGHSDLTKPQKDNPDIVGYGAGAKMGTFGPENIPAILAERLCYVKGQYEEAKKYPERSPEFKPLTANITGLALLKTDPKLPMGMMTYGDHKHTVFYGSEFLGSEKEEEESPKKGKEPGEKEESGPSALPRDPTQPPTSDELPPEHKELAEKYMEHYKQNDPLMRYMCTKYEAEQAEASAPLPEEVDPAMADAQNENEDADAEKPGKDKPVMDEEKVNMSQDALAINYADEINALKATVATLKDLPAKVAALSTVNQGLAEKYSASEAKRIVQGLRNEGFVIKSPQKLLDKLSKTDDAGRKAIVEDVRENYAQQEVRRDPSQNPDIEISDDPAEGGENYSSGIADDPNNMTEMIQYAEKHKLSMTADWDKIVKAIASKNGRAVKA